ncbi:MAG: T9SS type A sorting domain-containing protein [Bacteroidia bacterium]
MKRYFYLFLTALLLFCLKGKAQDSLGISHYTYVQASNDTLPIGSTDSSSIWIVNRGSTVFNGNINVKSSVQDSTLLSVYHPGDTASVGTSTISPGDSIHYTFHTTYTFGSAYHNDINVIVIWPVATGAVASDSLTFTEVLLTVSAGINQLNLNKYIKVYPNPATDKLIIENASKNNIEEVRIYDSYGQLINIITNESIINTENWCPGMYLLDINIKGQGRQTLKILKQ